MACLKKRTKSHNVQIVSFRLCFMLNVSYCICFCWQVLPGLYVGNYRDSKDTVQLEKFKITHILSIHDAARRLHSVSFGPINYFVRSTSPRACGRPDCERSPISKSIGSPENCRCIATLKLGVDLLAFVLHCT